MIKKNDSPDEYVDEGEEGTLDALLTVLQRLASNPEGEDEKETH